jgi:hypothetical protein
MNLKDKQQCYACGSPATGREHVPPKCLFPTELNKDYRKNLVTVPSCDTHNTSKSDDDEFLLASLAGIIGCNNIGLTHKFTKVNRAIRRTGGKLLEKALKEQRVEWYQVETGEVFDVTWGKPDIERLSRCFSLIGKGLYHYDHGERFTGNVNCEIVYISINDSGRMGFRQFVVDEIKAELAKSPIKGDNPAVFQWSLGPLDASGACCGKMIFYGTLEVYLGFIPEVFSDVQIVSLYEIARDISKPVFIKKGNRKYRIN